MKKQNEAQITYNKLKEISEQIKELYSTQKEIMENFYAQYEDYEFPIIVDEKEKFFRIFEPEGRFVYNVKHEIGLRAKAQKLFNK